MSPSASPQPGINVGALAPPEPALPLVAATSRPASRHHHLSSREKHEHFYSVFMTTIMTTAKGDRLTSIVLTTPTPDPDPSPARELPKEISAQSRTMHGKGMIAMVKPLGILVLLD
jgi:hypothetical protein